MSLKRLKRLIAVFFISISLGFCFYVYAEEKGSVEDINNSIVRFHIRANSNTELDQDMKMAAREYFFKNFSLKNAENKEEALLYFSKNERKIEETLNKFLEEQNVSYKCNVKIKKEMFPVREYNDFTLPAGVYDAIVITLGKGEGDNFFCVMYPSLCMLDGVTQTTDEKLECLEGVLADEEIKLISSNSEKTVIKFKIIEILDKFF